MIVQPTQTEGLAANRVVLGRLRDIDQPHATTLRSRGRARRVSLVPIISFIMLLGTAGPVLSHEDQVIQYGSFLAGLTHPVLGLDHFVAMVSVGIVSALIGGRAIWVVPTTFVIMMGVGGVAGYVDIGITSSAIETGIAVSVVLLGAVIALDQRLDVRLAMAFVAFFGFFHGYAHGQEIPGIAEPAVYAFGFIAGTVLIHLLGLLIGEVAIRYTYGRQVLRVVGAGFVVIGLLFMVGVL